ncbi:uncharacterized protein [Patagioenas fasciata]|uniref:uncharacterized protein isoform X4 n=1 Tax=Patagioenas fasciata TaxID=372321 RepID=UPI0032E9085B
MSASWRTLQDIPRGSRRRGKFAASGVLFRGVFSLGCSVCPSRKGSVIEEANSLPLRRSWRPVLVKNAHPVGERVPRQFHVLQRKSMAPLSCGSISVLFRGVFNLGCSVDPFCSRWPTIAWKQQKLFAPAERIERTSRWRMLKTPGSLMEAALHKARGLKGATYGAPSFATRTPNHRDNVAVQLLRTVCVSAF